MCPVCLEPNTPGRAYCHRCWGASLSSEPLLTLAEIKQRKTEIRSRRRAKTLIKRMITIGVPSAAAVVSVILFLYFFTDTIYKPRADINSNSAPGEWAMYGRDLGHTGSSASSSAVPEGRLKWAFSTGGAIRSSPAVVNGTVYVGSTDHRFYAVDAATGMERWSFQAGSWVESSPAVTGNTVFIGSNDGNMYALNAETGEKIWEFPTIRVVKSSPAIADGKVFFGSENDHVYCLDAETGKELWTYQTDDGILDGPAVANGILYVGEQGDYFYAIDAVSGRLRLRFDAYGSPSGSPAVVGNTVYFVTSNGILFAVDGNARSWPREHPVRLLLNKIYIQSLSIVPPMWLIPPNQSGYIWGLKLGKPINSAPAIAGGRLYIGSGSKLFAIDISERKLLWEFETGAQIRSSAAVAGGTVYTCNEDGKLYAVDSSTGKELWQFATGDMITSSPAIVDGIIYVGSHDGNLYAIE